jgi:hypothetical protein
MITAISEYISYKMTLGFEKHYRASSITTFILFGNKLFHLGVGLVVGVATLAVQLFLVFTIERFLGKVE